MRQRPGCGVISARAVRRCSASEAVPVWSSTTASIQGHKRGVFRLMRRLAIVFIAALALWWMMPPAARELPPPAAGLTPGLRGVIHIHTNRSDGTGSVDDVLRAAATAGLKF